MAPRKKNPIQDIINTTSAWLGGSRGRATNPQVRAAMNATRAVGKVVDTATGGVGSALLSDAQRMAQSGSSTPSALYKTAAVNLAAAAVGYRAAKVAQGVVRKVAPQLMQDVGVHFSRNKNITGSIKATPELRGTGKGPSTKANFEINVPVAKGKTYKFSGFGPTLGSKTKAGEVLPASKFQDFMSAQDTAYVTRSRLGKVDTENPALYKSPKIEDWFERGGKYQSQRVTGRQRIIQVVPDYYDNKLTNAVQSARTQLEVDRETVRRVAAAAAALSPKKNRGSKNKR
jgi:hypothetical protein